MGRKSLLPNFGFSGIICFAIGIVVGVMRLRLPKDRYNGLALHVSQCHENIKAVLAFLPREG
jgi:hypothetical protein